MAFGHSNVGRVRTAHPAVLTTNQYVFCELSPAFIVEV